MGYIDYAILAIYVLFVLGIGFALKRSMKSSSDFFMSGRAIPAWITGLAFISANLGALELVGMGASGAKYGIAQCHFYWIGAIPGMVFLARRPAACPNISSCGSTSGPVASIRSVLR
jgi:SSS family solute:Na+ symporter